MRDTSPGDDKTSRDFLEFMAAGATSKTIASVVAYPHEVARTRLREEGNKYRSFWQTIHTVWKEEGKAGLYRWVGVRLNPLLKKWANKLLLNFSGLGTQLVRQIPNTAIMMATYEAVVYVLSNQFNNPAGNLMVGNWEQADGGGTDTGYRFPALATLLERARAAEEEEDVTSGTTTFEVELESAFIVHCISDFFVDL